MKIATSEWRPWLPWGWAALTIVGVVAGFLAGFIVAVVSGGLGLLELLGNELRIDLAAWLLGWGALSIGGVLLAGRLTFGRWLPVAPGMVAVPCAGLLLAAALELALHAWAHARFGYYDAEMIGWTAGLSFVLVLVAIALFGVLVAPRGASTPPMLALALSAGLVALVAVSNVGGALDGIPMDSWPLAVMVGLATAYAAGASVLATRRVRLG